MSGWRAEGCRPLPSLPANQPQGGLHHKLGGRPRALVVALGSAHLLSAHHAAWSMYVWSMMYELHAELLRAWHRV